MQENVIVKLAEHYGVAERIIGPHTWNQANDWALEMTVAEATLLHDGEHQDEFLFQHDAKTAVALDHPTPANYPTGPLPTTVVARNEQKESS